MGSIRRARGIVLLAQGMYQSATTGWAANLNQRLAEHAAGRGARLLAVVQAV